MRQFKLSNDPQFAAKLRDVVGLYVDPPALHDLVRDVVAHLKADAGFQDALQTLLGGTAPVPAPDALAAVLARVEALETWRASIAAPPGNPSHLCEHLESPALEASPDASQQLADAPGLFDNLSPTAAAPVGGEQPAQATTSPAPSPAGLASKPKRHRLTDQQRAEIVKRNEAGEGVMVISRAMGIPQPTVSHVLKVARASKDSAA